MVGRNYSAFIICDQHLGNVVEWLERQDCDQHGFGKNLFAPFCCILGKDTLRHFHLLGGFGKQF